MDGEEIDGVKLAEAALQDGLSPLDFFQEVISPVVKEIGDQFARLEIFLPELMKAGVVVKAIQSEVLAPAIRKSGGDSGSAGTIVVGTSQGDIHDIGKNMVALMLQVNAFQVVDLGTNVSPSAFIDAAKRENADIIAVSTLLTSSLPFNKDLIELLKGMGQRERFAVVAGGAAVSKQWVEQYGFDGYGGDAVEAVEVCGQIVQNRKGN